MCPDAEVSVLEELLQEQTEKRTRHRTDSEKSQSEVKRLPIFRNTQIRLRKAQIIWERINPQPQKTERSRSLSALQQFTNMARRRNTLWYCIKGFFRRKIVFIYKWTWTFLFETKDTALFSTVHLNKAEWNLVGLVLGLIRHISQLPNLTCRSG